MASPTLAPPPSASPNILQSLANAVLDAVEDVACALSDQPRLARTSPWLQGDWAPQRTTGVFRDLPVAGEMPDVIDGAFMRVGPNFAYAPRTEPHLFDGDGAVATWRVSAGKVSFSWSFVETEKLAIEAGRRGRFALIGSMKGAFGMMHIALSKLRAAVGPAADPSTANTALVEHAGRILALNEGFMPYALRVLCDGAMETLGRVVYEGYEGPMTAHPKLHAPSGSMIYVNYSLSGSPACSVQVVGKDGALERGFDVRLPRAAMMHDCQVTDKYIVVMDLPLVLNPKLMMMPEEEGGGIPIHFDKSIKSRFGLLPVDTTDDSQMRWFEFPDSFIIFHTAFAVDDEKTNTVVVWACVFEEFDMNIRKKTDVDQNGKTDELPSYLNKITLHLDTGKAERQPFPMPNWSSGSSAPKWDFPIVARDKSAASTNGESAPRYIYMTGYEESRLDARTDLPGIVGLAKFDTVTEREVGRLRFGRAADEPVHGSEVAFVRRRDAVEEDDGYLVGMVNDYGKEGSFLRVYDAKTMCSVSVAEVRCALRVPSGFHSIFVPTETLNSI